MEILLRTGFEEITHNLKFKPNTLKNGEKLAFRHICSVEEKSDQKIKIITAKCVRTTSQSKEDYKVSLKLNDVRDVVDCSCTCIAQALKRCKHIYALIYRINNDRSLSKTCFKQLWGQPPESKLVKEMYSKGMPISTLFPQNEPKKIVPVYNLQPEDLVNLNCPLRDVVIEESLTAEKRSNAAFLKKSAEDRAEQDENECIEGCALSFLNMLEENEFYKQLENEKEFTNDQVKNFYEKLVLINESDAIKLCIKTKKQNKCAEWFDNRYVRITASSKAHKIKRLRNKSAQSLVNDFLTQKVLRNKNVIYGAKNEKIALDAYSKLYNVDVIRVGLFVPPALSWLGVSLDGVIVNNGEIVKLVEIKCPISCEKIPIIDETTKTSNVPYLNIVNGIVELKKSSEYFTQCQIQMFATGLFECDLFVWSPIGYCTVVVDYDEQFILDVVPKLLTFYFTFFLPKLYDDYKVKNKWT